MTAMHKAAATLELELILHSKLTWSGHTPINRLFFHDDDYARTRLLSMTGILATSLSYLNNSQLSGSSVWCRQSAIHFLQLAQDSSVNTMDNTNLRELVTNLGPMRQKIPLHRRQTDTWG
jgi:hypothetical protein